MDDSAIHVSAETGRRLACDANVVRMTNDDHGTVLDVGRKTRTIVHEGGFTLERGMDGTVVFFDRDRWELRTAPPQPRVDLPDPLAPTTERLAAQGIVITPRTLPTWEGGP